MRNKKQISTALNKIKSGRLDDSGATAIEYALIAGLVFLAIVGAINYYAGSLGNLFNEVSTNVSGSL